MRRWPAWALLVLVLGFVAPMGAVRAAVLSSQTPQADSVASCEAYFASRGWPAGRCTDTRQVTIDVRTCYTTLGIFGGSQYAGDTFCQAAVDCLAKPVKQGPVDNIGGEKCFESCVYQPDGSSLPEKWTVAGTGRSAGFMDWKPTGALCGTSGLPIPPVITKLCGGSSCVDTNLGQACAGVEGGGQVCVPLNTHGNGAGPACGGNESMALCAGNPPPAPPNPPISDPPTQIAGTDKFTHDPGGGQPQTTTTVNNYNNSGSPPSNGAGSGPDTSKPPAGELGGDPAPSGSTAGPAGSFGGGGDCNSPPVCTGDAVMCGVAKQQWLTMCSAKGSADAQSMTVTKLFGDGNNPPESPPVQDANGLWVPSAPSDGSIGGEANEGFYNTLGFGAPSACPLHDLVVPVPGGSSVTIPLQQGCDPLGYLRYLLIAGALYRATRITMGGNG